MKPEEHIYFLSELLYAINELQTLVREYCREMTTGEEERPEWIIDKNDGEKVPF